MIFDRGVQSDVVRGVWALGHGRLARGRESSYQLLGVFVSGHCSIRPRGREASYQPWEGSYQGIAGSVRGAGGLPFSTRETSFQGIASSDCAAGGLRVSFEKHPLSWIRPNLGAGVTSTALYLRAAISDAQIAIPW